MAGGANLAAFLEDRRPTAAVDRAVHPTSPKERRVRGVDDRVDRLLRDVALDELDPHDPMMPRSTRA
jgi:hypothetical protein